MIKKMTQNFALPKWTNEESILQKPSLYVSIEEDGMNEWIPCKGYSSNVSLWPCLHTSTTYMMRATRTEAAKEPLTINAISQLSKSFSILSRMSSNSLPTMVPRMPLMKPPLQVSPMKVTLPSIASIVS